MTCRYVRAAELAGYIPVKAKQTWQNTIKMVYNCLKGLQAVIVAGRSAPGGDERLARNL